jgi:hypothetical protein
VAWVAPYLPGTPAGSSPRRAGTSRFCIARNTRVPRVPLRTNPTASLTREWKGPTRLAPGHIHAHSSRCHALQGLRGPNRGRRAHQGPALRDHLWQPAVPARALRGVLTSARANRHVRRSLVAHVRRTEDTGSISGRLGMPARHAGRHVVWVHGKVAGIGLRARFECAYHRCSRRGFSDRHLLHHLLTRHSTRRRAPEKLPFFSHPARARPAFGNRAS